MPPLFFQDLTILLFTIVGDELRVVPGRVGRDAHPYNMSLPRKYDLSSVRPRIKYGAGSELVEGSFMVRRAHHEREGGLLRMGRSSVRTRRRYSVRPRIKYGAGSELVEGPFMVRQAHHEREGGLPPTGGRLTTNGRGLTMNDTGLILILCSAGCQPERSLKIRREGFWRKHRRRLRFKEAEPSNFRCN